MPLSKRSFERQEGSLNGKGFFCRDLFGEYLDKNPYCYGYDVPKASKGLSQNGQRIIKKFINQNLEKEKKLKKQEQDSYDELHDKNQSKSKKPIWKSGLHIIEHFGGPMIDYKYEFLSPKTVKHLINQPPFRRPKEKGDYLDSNIHFLEEPKNNYT